MSRTEQELGLEATPRAQPDVVEDAPVVAAGWKEAALERMFFYSEAELEARRRFGYCGTCGMTFGPPRRLQSTTEAEPAAGSVAAEGT